MGASGGAWPSMRGQGEQAARVVAGCLRDVRGGALAQFGDASQYPGQVRWFVALVAMRGVRLIGAVGFQQQVLQGHGGDNVAQAGCAFVGHGAADAKVKIHVPQAFGLFEAAGKTVYHAAQPAHRAQFEDDFLDCTQGVHDDGQIEFACKHQLASKKSVLPIGVGSAAEKVQSAFADGNGVAVRQPSAQIGEMLFRLLLGQKQRVPSIGGVNVSVICAQCSQRGPASGAGGGHDDVFNAGGARARQHRVAVGVERGGVEVAMAVDEWRHATTLPCWRDNVEYSWPIGFLARARSEAYCLNGRNQHKEKSMNFVVLPRVTGVALLAGCCLALGACNKAADANAVQYAQVTGVKPITKTTSTPQQVCNDVTVQHQGDPKDKHEIIGAAIGAVVGGVAGNQVGGGNGKKLATVAGAVAGGYAGKKIEEAHQQPQITTSVDRQCKTVNDKHTSVVAYDVTYVYNGVVQHARMQHKPGDKIAVKQGVVVVGDDGSHG